MNYKEMNVMRKRILNLGMVWKMLFVAFLIPHFELCENGTT